MGWPNVGGGQKWVTDVIPSDLNELFRDILARDSHHRDELLLCIQWVLFAKEPLTPEQLYFAILAGVEVDATEALSDWDSKDITADVMKRFILDSSKGLTEVTKSKIPTVQFIHESVRDFLLKHDGLSQIWSEFGIDFSGQCHERLRRCCINYINAATSMEIGKTLPKPSSGEANELRESAEKRLPFLRYATQQVLYHSDAAEEAGVSQIDFLQSFDLAGWIILDNLFEKHKIRRHTPNASLLYILAEQDRASLICINRSKIACFAVEDERYGAPILAALATGSSGALRAFLTAHKEANPKSLALLDFRTSSHQQRATLIKPSRDFNFNAKKGILFNAFALGSTMVVALLLELEEAHIDVTDPRFGEAMSNAAKRGHLDICKFFVEIDGFNIDQKDKNGVTPFLFASEHGHEAIVRLLIETGQVDIKHQDKSGRTAFSHASEQGNYAVVKLLLETGAVEVDSRGNSGRTPLSYAAECFASEAKETVKLLLETGKTDVDSRDNSGRTPFSYAMLNNMKLLLDTGMVEVDSRGNSGRTPLSYAAGRFVSEMKEIVKLLLETGQVEVESRDVLGRTPLSHAVEHGTVATVKILLDAGKASPCSKDKNGNTPSNYANRRLGSDGDLIVGLLERHLQ